MFESINPATGEPIEQVPFIDDVQLEQRLQSTALAAEQWQQHTIEARATLLMAVAEQLSQSRETLARLMAQEMGKLYREGLAEVDKCASACVYFAEANVVMPYYWGSKGVKPNDGYPLFIYLHGSGDKNSEWSAGISLANQFKDGPSAYFVPQIPSMRAYRWWHKSKQFAWEKLLRLSFITGDIDQNKVYFMGISEGGYGSQRLASFYADYLAGAGPMAGGEPLINAPVENCRNIAFSLRTGAEDYGFYRNQFTKTAKDRFDAFEAKYPGSFVHFIDIIPGMGHGIDYFPTTPWLRKYKRNPYPKFVSWENFPMDGRYRDKFYNLLVKERSNADDNTRTYYEMQINGNSVSLKVSEMTYTATEKDQRWGIGMKYDRTYVPANKGKVVIYFNDKLIDLNNEVSISVNGKLAFRGMLKLSRKNIVESCAAFFDPYRLYPASVEVDLSALK